MKNKWIFILIFSLLFCEGKKERFVSLGPAITESIFILGKGDRIVGNTIYCTRPEEAKYIEKVGNVIDVNVEKIYSLKPDIVFATNLTNQKDIRKMKQLGLKIEIFGYPVNFQQLCNDFLRIGKIIGEEKKAREIIEKVKKEIKKIKVKKERPKILIQVGTRPLWVAGKDAFVNDIIEFAGGKNVINGKGGIYSIEEIVKLNPDVIVITSMGIDAEEEKKFWEKYKMINAVKNRKIFVIESDKICSPTPLSFVDAVKELNKLIYEVNPCEK
ncbi:MAG: helical backbone metal receptor [Candidatus Omnitrophica bacterium]|nr:helical backbone metal receptor [Candidatus Omnitrophota bacterium]